MEISKNKPFAVIDIGSNTVRLVVFKGQNRASFSLYNERLQCELGKDIWSTGKLSPEGCSSAIAAVRRFVSLANAMRAKICIVGTAAVRDAKDGHNFLKKIQEMCSVKVDVLSGSEEARLSYLGVFSGFFKPSGFVGDLGGGSLELIGTHDLNFCSTKTLAFGTLRQNTSFRREKDLIYHMDVAFEEIDWLPKYKGQIFYAVGGAWRALARVHMARSNYPIPVIHHYTISSRDALDFCNFLSTLSFTSLNKISILSKVRRKTLPHAALVLERILLAVQPSSVVFSAFGLREGILHDQISAEAKSKDPLLASCREISEAKGNFLQDIHEVHKWLEPIFINYPETESRLIEASGLLSNIAFQVQPSHRGEFAFDCILYAPLAGVSHSERVFLAVAAAARYREQTNKSFVHDFLHPEQIRRAKIVGASFDLAYTITGGVGALLASSRINYADDNLEIHLTSEARPLVSQGVVRRLKTLSRYLRCEYSIM